MKKYLQILGALFVVMIFSSSQVQAQDMVTVTGRVLKLSNGSAINKATVSVVGQDNVVKTDENGAFSIEVPVGQEISLRIYKKNFKRALLRHTFNASRRGKRLTVKLGQGQEESTIDIR